MSTERDRINHYFAENPEEIDGVRRATFAYHLEAGEHPNAHKFSSGARWGRCAWCERTRESVRWDGQPPQCAKRLKAIDSIESVIAREERQFEKVLNRAQKLAAKIDVAALTGEELSRIHHTHGIDPSMLEAALMLDGLALPQSLHDEYQRAYADHRETGKRGLVRELIIARTAEESKS